MAQIDRAEKNRQFQAMGEKFVKEYPLAMGHLTMKWFIAAKGCMEQLGRMVKAEMEADTIAKQAKIAAAAINEGRTVKQVEAYLRHGRTTGEWNESLLTATREAASNAAKPVEGLTLDDLRAIEWILDIEIQVYIKDMEAFSHMDDKDEAIIALGNRARFIEYYQQKLQAAIKSAGGELQR